MVLHEIGHASAVTMVGEMIRVVGSTPILVVIVLLAVNSSWTYATVVIELVLAALFLGTNRGAWDRQRSTILRDAEIAADIFALQTLPKKDFETIINVVERITINDTAMSAEENFQRNLYLRENAKNMRSGRTTVLAPPTLNRAPPFIVLLIVTFFFMGAVSESSPELTTFAMCGALLLLVVTNMILLSGVNIQTNALNATLLPKNLNSASEPLSKK